MTGSQCSKRQRNARGSIFLHFLAYRRIANQSLDPFDDGELQGVVGFHLAPFALQNAARDIVRRRRASIELFYLVVAFARRECRPAMELPCLAIPKAPASVYVQIVEVTIARGCGSLLSASPGYCGGIARGTVVCACRPWLQALRRDHALNDAGFCFDHEMRMSA